jgi:hypothetical protein
MTFVVEQLIFEGGCVWAVADIVLDAAVRPRRELEFQLQFERVEGGFGDDVPACLRSTSLRSLGRLLRTKMLASAGERGECSLIRILRQ